ncbi:MAG: YjbQ family protein [Phycisphaerae bacterium]|nr:YjbQ family protein [Phycisphaerae bacterium]
MKTVDVRTKRRCEFVDVTREVEAIAGESGVKQGLCVCFVPHTTAGVTIQENADPDVTRDLDYKLGELIPKEDRGFRHNEGNSDAHLKSSLLGASQTLLIQNGRLVLGTWQAIYFAEFDGPRQRKMHVEVMGGASACS